MNKRTAIEIINSRDNLSKEITKLWNIVYAENIVKRGYKRNYNMKECIEKIQKMADDRMIDKLDSLCINLGFMSPDQLSSDSIYPTIFKLSELNEQYVKLGKINTINTKYKNTKKGKKDLEYTEELTSDYITRLRNNLVLEIIGLKKKIADFNESHYLDKTKTYMFLAA